MKKIFVIFLVLGFLLGGCAQQEIHSNSEDGGIHSAPKTCVDSDGGKNEFVAGTVTAGSETGTDRCLGNGKSVMEYYCDENEMKSEDIPCPDGQKCFEGACEEITCFDSDGGTDTSMVGTVMYDGVQYTDECIDASWVREYSCQNGFFEETIQCAAEEECSGGKCVGIPDCSDSDGGEEVYIKGTVTYGTDVYVDYCLSYNVVYEYYCENGAMQKKQIICPGGAECTNGYCSPTEAKECEDTDGGKSTYKKGTVTYWSGGQEYSETDKCYDSYSVLEVWCTDTETVGFGIIECEGNEWCEDGECTD